MNQTHSDSVVLIGHIGLQVLLDVLLDRGYRIIGPTLEDKAIVLDEITATGDLPQGWTDQHEAGSYRLVQRDDDALFGYNLGSRSWKDWLHPQRIRLWEADKDGSNIRITLNPDPPPKLALLGVRSCELHAMGIQDTVFSHAVHEDLDYQARRNHSLVIAVNCVQAGGTCFCVSMQTGPQVTESHDLSLTELLDSDGHRFVLSPGSKEGRSIMAQLTDSRPATPADMEQAAREVDSARQDMGRKLDTQGIKELLQANLEHPQWEDVASRCLSCANCTMVCPTCFCTSVEDVTGLDADHAERWRRSDSCFTMDFSYIHGGTVRASAASRYRQWMTHKLAHWIDQFGSSGCVGCGRCITWCPVGIDITSEAANIRSTDMRTESA